MEALTHRALEQVHASALEKLSPDLMVAIAEFLGLIERIRVASAGPMLRKLVYQDCPALWVNIDFSTAGYDACNRVTDEEIASLLTRVNARTVTKVLSLRGCDTNVCGSGLSPLRNSQVLERLDIRAGARADFRAENFRLTQGIVLPTLRTMLPYNLWEVHFRPFRSNYARAKFYHDLLTSRRQQALEQQLLCSGSSCHHPVVDTSLQVVPNLRGLPLHRCGKCDGQFCLRGSCPVDVKTCRWCDETRCSNCTTFKTCDQCANCFCGERCEDECVQCTACRGTFCCRIVRKCSMCDNAICSNPCADRVQISVHRCIGCEVMFCTDCRDSTRCSGCLEYLCNECDDFKRCDVCDHNVCSNCFIPAHCHECSRNICGACEETCGTCNKALCSRCQLYCGECCEFFCNDDCAFVDVCEQCENVSCEKCATVLRCSWCGKASCDECRGSGDGFCLMCEKSPKRARTSRT